MRILYLVQYFNRPDEPGGSRAYQFARHWSGAGHEVEVVTAAINHKTGEPSEDLGWRLFSRKEEGGYAVRRVRSYARYRGRMRRRYLSFLSYALSAILFSPRRPRPDVVFASSTPLTTGLAGAVVSRLAGAPFVFEARDLWPKAAVVAGVVGKGALLRMAERLERWIYARSQAIVVVSEGDRQELLARGLAGERVHFVPNGVDDWMVEEEPSPLPNRDGPLRVAYVGAHGRWNHLDVILDLAPRLEGLVSFALVGDGDEKERLVERARREGIRNVAFTSALPKREAFRRLQQAHAAIIVCGTNAHYEQWLPNKVFDYMAAGRPVAIIGRGELQRLVETNACGRSAPAGDAESACRLLGDLAGADRAQLEEMGRAGRRLARERFARRDLAERMIDIFRSAVDAA